MQCSAIQYNTTSFNSNIKHNNITPTICSQHMEDKMRSNMLRRKFYFCSDQVKNKLFSAYCNNIYMCSLWVSYRKRCMRQFIVSYNNSFRIVRTGSLPMRCSASAMFASSNVDSCQARIRRSIYSLRFRLDVSSRSTRLLGSAAWATVQGNCMNSGAETSQNSVKTNGGWLNAQSARHVVKITESTSMRYSMIWTLLNVVATAGKCPGWHVYSLANDTRAVSTHPKTSMATCLSHRTNFWMNGPSFLVRSLRARTPTRTGRWNA